MARETIRKLPQGIGRREDADLSRTRRWLGTHEWPALDINVSSAAPPADPVEGTKLFEPHERHRADQTGENSEEDLWACRTPAVSVVLPVLNGEATIVRAVESILEQTYADLELIVVDDGSRDRTPAILSSFARIDHRVKIITNSVNIGIARSRNRALAAASGRYIMCSDADDWNAPTRLEKQVPVLDSDPKIGVVVSRVQLVDEYGSYIESQSPYEGVEPYWSGDLFRIKLNGFCPIHHGEATIRKDILERAGGYRPQFSLAEDYDLWLRLSMVTNFQMIDDIHYFRRKHPRQASSKLIDLHRFLSFLARECHYLRMAGHDDVTYLNAESDRLHQKFGRPLENDYRVTGPEFEHRPGEVDA